MSKPVSMDVVQQTYTGFLDVTVIAGIQEADVKIHQVVTLLAAFTGTVLKMEVVYAVLGIAVLTVS